MKRMIALIVSCLLPLISLSSCFLKKDDDYVSPSKQTGLELLEVVDAINKKDSEKIEKMLCSYIKDNYNVNTVIDELFDFFDGEIVIAEDTDPFFDGEKVDYDHMNTNDGDDYYARLNHCVTDKGTKYMIKMTKHTTFMEIDDHPEHPEMVGVNYLYVSNETILKEYPIDENSGVIRDPETGKAVTKDKFIFEIGKKDFPGNFNVQVD